MGEVWKARDTRLDRTVAIKVLPKFIADRDDLRARFEREARAVSSLKHPNICVLFDIGKQDGIDFMVLEHLEGETLAARVSKGPLPLDQVLKYAAQIADALDRAHRSDVCHRDVKPANIMLTRDGVKVLDFGLAKTPRRVGPDDVTGLAAALTSEGTILGTPQYMAPEQYEGKEADERSDIFAFGCVVYEMVTGKRCFDGKTKASLIASVLGGEPVPMSTLVPVTPPALERLVKRCIEKDPEDRYQSMRDVVLELRSTGASGADFRSARPSHKAAWMVAAAVLAIVAAVGLVGWYRATRPVDHPLLRLDVDLGADV
jgi:serine/threonine protein kinase